jgi:hypothetical protein
MSDDADKEKADLLRLLARVPGQCDELEAHARDILRQSREARDAARYQAIVVTHLPGNAPEIADYCLRASRSWEEFGQTKQQILENADISSLIAVVSGNTSTASVGAAYIVQQLQLPPNIRLTIEQAENDYSDTARLDQTFEDIKVQMKRLNLDSGNARYRNPLDLLEEAYTAIRYPVSAGGGPSSALLTLRGSIERSIEELVRRRVVQEEAGNRRDKILSIGRHCGKSGLPPSHFDSLSTDDGLVNDELSGNGKKVVMEWPALVRQFLRGAQFLRALLASVDEALLRP